LSEEEARLPPKGLKVHRYELDGGWEVWAGKSQEDNDRLSIKVASPNDWWFHVRGMPGSHVVLFVGAGQDPPRAVVKEAAAIAAYHSKAREGGLVPVAACRARYVTKPPKAKPGTVSIRKEEIIKVRPKVPVVG